MNFFDYQVDHPREKGIPHDEYELKSYQDWKAGELEDIQTNVLKSRMGGPGSQLAAVIDAVERLVDILIQDPRR